MKERRFECSAYSERMSMVWGLLEGSAYVRPVAY